MQVIFAIFETFPSMINIDDQSYHWPLCDNVFSRMSVALQYKKSENTI